MNVFWFLLAFVLYAHGEENPARYDFSTVPSPFVAPQTPEKPVKRFADIPLNAFPLYESDMIGYIGNSRRACAVMRDSLGRTTCVFEGEIHNGVTVERITKDSIAMRAASGKTQTLYLLSF